MKLMPGDMAKEFINKVADRIQALNLNICIETFDEHCNIAYQLDIADRNIGVAEEEKNLLAYAVPGHLSHLRQNCESDYLIVPTYDIKATCISHKPEELLDGLAFSVAEKIMLDVGRILHMKADNPKHEIVMPIVPCKSYIVGDVDYLAGSVRVGLGLI